MKLKNYPFFEQVTSVHPKKDFYKFVLSEKVLQQCSNIKLDDEYRLLLNNDFIDYGNSMCKILKLLPNRQCFLFYPSSKPTIYNKIVFEYYKRDNYVLLTHHSYLKNGLYIQYFQSFNLETNEVLYHQRTNNKEGLDEKITIQLDKFFMDTMGGNFSFFILGDIIEFIVKPMIFIELSKSNIKLIDIKPKSEYGNIMKPIHIKNQTNVNITYVNSLWNVNTIGIGEFKVRGHFRLQKCGLGYSEVKLIYIEDFVKTHYIRRSTRDIVFDEVPTKEKELV